MRQSIQKLVDPKLIRWWFVGALAILGLITVLSLLNTRKLKQTNAWVAHTNEVIARLDDLMITILDAESGQRGFIITGLDSYLSSYHSALTSVHSKTEVIRSLTNDNPAQQSRVEKLESSIQGRLFTLEEVLEKRRAEGFDSAQQVIFMGGGKIQMDQIRAEIVQIKQVEFQLLERREAEATASTITTLTTFALGLVISFALLVFVFYLLNHQIAERRAAEQAVTGYARQLEAANKDLEAFSYSTSHDLRAPLRHVSGYAELLQKNAGSALDAKGEHYVQTIIDSAKRMGNLIDHLLAFSRLGRAQMKVTDVNLEKMVREAIDELRIEMNGREVAMTIGKLPRVKADPSLLRLVFTNLISNALKFTRQTQPAKVEIGYRQQPDEVVVFVKDNGSGFDMKYVDKLFGVFQRLHDADQFEGTGIGLANVRRIISRHGGRTWAEGAVGEGATFYFSLNTGSTSLRDDLPEGVT